MQWQLNSSQKNPFESNLDQMVWLNEQERMVDDLAYRAEEGRN